MLGLAFLNPMLLWALPLAAVPIIIHILNRRRFKKVPWAAMEFLLKAMKRNRKRLRMEQWLVLLLRVLAVLLLVALVSRPRLDSSGLLGQRTHHVIVVDDSASMTQRSGSSDLFSKAQDRIRLLADDLGAQRSGDLFSIVRVSTARTPDMWAQRIGNDFGRRAGTMLKQITVTDRALELGKAFKLTVERAQQIEDVSRTEYYLVGDRRSWDWSTSDDKPRPALLAALASLQADREHVTVLTIGGNHDNVAVVDVRMQNRLAIAAVPVTVLVDVKNFGLDPTAASELVVEVDGQTRITQSVPVLAPGERTSVPIQHTFHQPGPHRVDVVLEQTEAFPFDDRRSLALHVRDRSRVLLVDGEPDVDQGETFFVQATLEVPNSGVETQVVSETGFDDVNLDVFDLVWWCNVQAPTEAAAKRLERFVADGGGLAIACGSLVDASRYNELLWREGEGPLPLPIGEISGDPDRPEHGVLVAREHPMTAGPISDLFDLLLGVVVQFKRWLVLEEPAGHRASIVARIRDAEGPPLFATRAFGENGGQVTLFAISADTHWSTMPSTDLMLVTTHQLHGFAARRDDLGKDNLDTAGTYELELDPGRFRADVRLRAVDGEDERTFTAVAPGTLEAAAGQPGTNAPGAANNGAQPANPVPQPAADGVLRLVVPMTELASRGVYEVELERHDGIPEKRVVARNAPGDEGHLIAFDETSFKKLYPQSVHDLVTFVREQDGIGSDVGEGEAWPLLAMLLLFGLLAESLLAWRFGRR